MSIKWEPEDGREEMNEIFEELAKNADGVEGAEDIRGLIGALSMATLSTDAIDTIKFLAEVSNAHDNWTENPEKFAQEKTAVAVYCSMLLHESAAERFRVLNRKIKGLFVLWIVLVASIVVHALMSLNVLG